MATPLLGTCLRETKTDTHTLYAHWEVANSAPGTPIISNVTHTYHSISLNAVSEDPDGDDITYTLYVNGNVADTKTAASGTTIALEATGLDEITNYIYYVVARDESDLTSMSSVENLTTQCSGSTQSHNATYCDGICDTCDGTGGDGYMCKGTPCPLCEGGWVACTGALEFESDTGVSNGSGYTTGTEIYRCTSCGQSVSYSYYYQNVNER